MEDLDEKLKEIFDQNKPNYTRLQIPVTKGAKEYVSRFCKPGENFIVLKGPSEKMRRPYGSQLNNEDMDDETLMKFKYLRLRNQARTQRQNWDLELDEYKEAWKKFKDKIRDRRYRIYRLDPAKGWVKDNLLVGKRGDWMKATGRLK